VQTETGYAMRTWTRATQALSPPRAVELPYDTADPAWLDEHRVAFDAPPRHDGFRWIDVDRGDTGLIPVSSETGARGLVRAHGTAALAFVTQSKHAIHVWKLDGTTPHQLATVPVTSPPGRTARLAWATDDESIILFEATGEMWSIRLDGTVVALPQVSMPRTGGFPALTGLHQLPGRTLAVTLTRSADVYVNAPPD
jgi:hypothetical protein